MLEKNNTLRQRRPAEELSCPRKSLLSSNDGFGVISYVKKSTLIIMPPVLVPSSAVAKEIFLLNTLFSTAVWLRRVNAVAAADVPKDYRWFNRFRIDSRVFAIESGRPKCSATG